MGVSINNTISQISNLVDVDVSPLSNGDALIYVSATGDWTATALPGGGDMLKATYDTDLDGVVDTAHDVSATPLITRSSVASQGGLLINIDSATGDIAKTANGWIENERFGCWLQVSSNAVSAEFDTAIIPGEKVLKLSSTDVTGNSFVHLGYDGNFTATASIPSLYKYAFPVKASTKYILKYPVKTETVGTNGVYSYLSIYQTNGTRNQLLASTKFSGTNDWTWVTHAFTTGATDAFASIGLRNEIAGTISNAYFRLNYMTLEEVVEPVANSLTSSSPSLVSFTAVGSTDNIDQSQLTVNDARGVGGDGSTSTITNKIAQQFLPSKSKLTGIVIRKVADIGVFTGTITAKIVNDNAGVIGTTTLATITLSNATYQAIVNDTDYTLNLPCNLAAGTLYWITIEASTSDALNYARIRVQSGNPYTGGIFQSYYSGAWNTVAFDLYFKTLYYKPTTNFKASQNNLSVSVNADEDGFLNGSIINLSTGIASFTETFGTYYILDYTISGSDLIAEINLPGDSISASFTSDKSLTYSSDGATYGTTFPVGYKKIWVKILAYSGVTSFSYSIKFDNSLVTLRNYPTNKDVVIAYNMSLATATTTATYRATLYGFPAIEYATGVYQYLNIDTTATGSTVAFSSDGSSYTTVADGANIALSSTVNPLVWVKHNITANRLYLSSNDYNASSDKDGSNKMTVVYDVTSQGLTYTVDELLSEVNELKAAVYALQNP